MARKIILGRTYLTKSGHKFTPIDVKRGKRIGCSDWRTCGPRVYTDAEGHRVSKKNILNEINT